MKNDKAIKAFHNQLEIIPGRTILNIASDWLLSTKLKSRLTVTETIDNSRIYATVNNNTAYLMGTVTRPEAEKITELTQTLSNIKKIVLAFEYLN